MIDSARYQWEEGARRLDAERGDVARYHELVGLVEAVTDELRRRVGQTFTVAELAAAHGGAEEWVRDLVVEAASPSARTGVADTALVQDAAFARYALGATDYRP